MAWMTSRSSPVALSMARYSGVIFLALADSKCAGDDAMALAVQPMHPL